VSSSGHEAGREGEDEVIHAVNTVIRDLRVAATNRTAGVLSFGEGSSTFDLPKMRFARKILVFGWLQQRIEEYLLHNRNRNWLAKPMEA
jgi:hypothetical protein